MSVAIFIKHAIRTSRIILSAGACLAVSYFLSYLINDTLLEKNYDHKNYTKVITLSISTEIKTLRFADDQVIIAITEDNLRRGIFTLENRTKNFEWKYRRKKKIFGRWNFYEMTH